MTVCAVFLVDEVKERVLVSGLSLLSTVTSALLLRACTRTVQEASGAVSNTTVLGGRAALGEGKGSGAEGDPGALRARRFHIWL